MSMANSRPNTNVSQFFVTYASVNASASASVVDYRSHQMNAGLEVVENHRLDGAVYFADEEGVYSLQLFDRLRQIRCDVAELLIRRSILQWSAFFQLLNQNPQNYKLNRQL